MPETVTRCPTCQPTRVALSEARAYAQAVADRLTAAGLPLPTPPPWLSR